jgi:hypothetical protein
LQDLDWLTKIWQFCKWSQRDKFGVTQHLVTFAAKEKMVSTPSRFSHPKLFKRCYLLTLLYFVSLSLSLFQSEDNFKGKMKRRKNKQDAVGLTKHWRTSYCNATTWSYSENQYFFKKYDFSRYGRAVNESMSQ